ncbi:MAG: IS3 family transposase [Proteobacteria bacterium]|nr:IS3 family transposase [Desulfocapsa sp.]MBU3943337.1 IS3 family transposase [Pseudomonadota bacterium]MCG2744534.1 IS3 family transposase [Desulfobacteraceae bacterium]MBU4028494.1 IS3 family transposase [Pseudomonadota bacterium]MBU4043656.1 IS3 family transposase [Pseudomonadota bacterium]
MIDTVKKAYPIALLCDVMEVSRSGYYFWKNRGKSARQQEYEHLTSVVQEAHKVSKGTYGARRIAEEVEAHGVSCGRTKAATLMKLADVAAKQKMKFKVTTDSKHTMPVAPNLLNREFNVMQGIWRHVFTIFILEIFNSYVYTRKASIYNAGR